MTKRIHIVPNKAANRWVVKFEGEEKGRKFVTKKAAGRWATRLAQREQAYKVIHGLDGRFQNHKSY